MMVHYTAAYKCYTDCRATEATHSTLNTRTASRKFQAGSTSLKSVQQLLMAQQKGPMSSYSQSSQWAPGSQAHTGLRQCIQQHHTLKQIRSHQLTNVHQCCAPITLIQIHLRLWGLTKNRSLSPTPEPSAIA